MTPMRPVDASAVRARPGSAQRRRAWRLLVVLYVLDGVVWAATGRDLMYGLVVGAVVAVTIADGRPDRDVRRRLAGAALGTAVALLVGAASSAVVPVGLRPGARLAQGAAGIAGGVLVGWLTVRWRSGTRRGSEPSGHNAVTGPTPDGHRARP